MAVFSTTFGFCIMIRKAFSIPKVIFLLVFLGFVFNPSGTYFCDLCLRGRVSSFFFPKGWIIYFPSFHSFPADLFIRNSHINMTLVLGFTFLFYCSFCYSDVFTSLPPPFTQSNLAFTHNFLGIIPKCVNNLHVAKPNGYFFSPYLPEHYL